MKRLIINADDFNLTNGCNLAIQGCMDFDAVTSTSCLVWSSHAYRSVPTHCGVHLRLTDGEALLDGMKFPRSRQAVEAAWNAGTISAEFVSLEWRRQIEAFKLWKDNPTHFDTHRHTHSIPGIDRIYEQLCEAYGVAGVPLSGAQADRLHTRGVRSADHTEIRWTSGLLADLTLYLAEDFRRYETVHLMCHPGIDDEDLRAASSMTTVRERELAVLRSGAWRVWLNEQKIELIHMDELPQAKDPLAQVDVVYLAWNRREFTEASLNALLKNTEWSRVRKLWLYDDGSYDGTLGLLEDFHYRCFPVECEVVKTMFRSPVRTMIDYLTCRQSAPWFVKLDSDVIVPPGWLACGVDVLRKNREVDLLGLEAKHQVEPYHQYDDGARTAEPCGHIGGVGFMWRSAFREMPVAAGRLGFSDWQIKHDVQKAWLKPSLPVILLDRLPFEPWAALSRRYEDAGWQRPWERYTAADSQLWEWWSKCL